MPARNLDPPAGGHVWRRGSLATFPAREVPVEVVQAQGLVLVVVLNPVQRQIRYSLKEHEHPQGTEPPVDWQLRCLAASETVPLDDLDARSLTAPQHFWPEASSSRKGRTMFSSVASICLATSNQVRNATTHASQSPCVTSAWLLSHRVSGRSARNIDGQEGDRTCILPGAAVAVRLATPPV